MINILNILRNRKETSKRLGDERSGEGEGEGEGGGEGRQCIEWEIGQLECYITLYGRHYNK